MYLQRFRFKPGILSLYGLWAFLILGGTFLTVLHVRQEPISEVPSWVFGITFGIPAFCVAAEYLMKRCFHASDRKFAERRMQRNGA